MVNFWEKIIHFSITPTIYLSRWIFIGIVGDDVDFEFNTFVELRADAIGLFYIRQNANQFLLQRRSIWSEANDAFTRKKNVYRINPPLPRRGESMSNPALVATSCKKKSYVMSGELTSTDERPEEDEIGLG